MSSINGQAESKDAAQRMSPEGKGDAPERPTDVAAPAADRSGRVLAVCSPAFVLVGFLVPEAVKWVTIALGSMPGEFFHLTAVIGLLLTVVGLVLGIVAAAKKRWLGIAGIVLGLAALCVQWKYLFLY